MFTYKYPRPAVTADCVVFAQVKDQVKVLLIERGDEPCKGMWAIPGGFMNMDETAEEAAVRELKEETGIELTKVEQIGAFSKVDRDPRGRVITVAFYAVIGKAVKAVGQDDARRAKWFPLTKLPALAFDHAEILAAAMGMKISGVSAVSEQGSGIYANYYTANNFDGIMEKAANAAGTPVFSEQIQVSASVVIEYTMAPVE